MTHEQGTPSSPDQAVESFGERNVCLSRTGAFRFEATNDRGGRICLGAGETEHFTPVELLLAAIAGCAAIDVEAITAKRCAPERLEASAVGEKVKTGTESHMRNIRVSFDVVFPDDEAGARASERVGDAIRQSRERLCTVSRTVARGTPVAMDAADVK